MSVRIFGLRLKILAVFGASLVLSWVTITVVAQVAYGVGRAHRDGLIYAGLRWLRSVVGVAETLTLVGLGVFIGFVFLLSRRSLSYLEDVSKTLQRVSLGQLDIQVPERVHDELGEVGANVNRMVGRLRDALEDERRAAREKNDLIASVSHDLRTPLTSILGYLELLTAASSAIPDSSRQYAEVALQKSRQLSSLVDDLFEFTKVSDPAFTIRPERIDLAALVAQLAEESLPMLQTHAMTCRIHASDAALPVVADGSLLVRAFENLLSNAVRHGSAGRFVDIRLSRSDGQLLAAIVNYGSPIPPEALPRVFDRFFRADASRSRDTGGAGLGLATAKRIVELHGGTIRVASDSTETVFEIALPAVPGSPFGA
jgi:signal transduction histidine kinase